MKNLRIFVVLPGALACSPSHAGFESCFIEQVTATVSIVEGVNIWGFSRAQHRMIQRYKSLLMKLLIKWGILQDQIITKFGTR